MNITQKKSFIKFANIVEFSLFIAVLLSLLCVFIQKEVLKKGLEIMFTYVTLEQLGLIFFVIICYNISFLFYLGQKTLTKTENRVLISQLLGDQEIITIKIFYILVLSIVLMYQNVIESAWVQVWIIVVILLTPVNRLAIIVRLLLIFFLMMLKLMILYDLLGIFEYPLEDYITTKTLRIPSDGAPWGCIMYNYFYLWLTATSFLKILLLVLPGLNLIDWSFLSPNLYAMGPKMSKLEQVILTYTSVNTVTKQIIPPKVYNFITPSNLLKKGVFLMQDTQWQSSKIIYSHYQTSRSYVIASKAVPKLINQLHAKIDATHACVYPPQDTVQMLTNDILRNKVLHASSFTSQIPFTKLAPANNVFVTALQEVHNFRNLAGLELSTAVDPYKEKFLKDLFYVTQVLINNRLLAEDLLAEDLLKDPFNFLSFFGDKPLVEKLIKGNIHGAFNFYQQLEIIADICKEKNWKILDFQFTQGDGVFRVKSPANITIALEIKCKAIEFKAQEGNPVYKIGTTEISCDLPRDHAETFTKLTKQLFAHPEIDELFCCYSLTEDNPVSVELLEQSVSTWNKQVVPALCEGNGREIKPINLWIKVNKIG
jgi:hypothetical protein